VVGGEELVTEIARGGAGAIPFDKCLATADMMPKLARVARILGPRGMMPNPKLGTIVAPSALQQAVATLKAGRVEYRCLIRLVLSPKCSPCPLNPPLFEVHALLACPAHAAPAPWE
jgi:ribosomal protein L1